MSRRIGWLGAAAALALVCIAPASPLAQSPAPKNAPAKKYTAPRTVWGDPDLQGVWDYRTITPMERPANMAGRATLTDEEVTTLEARAAKRLDQPPDADTPTNTVHAPYMTDAEIGRAHV